MILRQSHLFTKTRKEAPKEEISKNAELLIRGGFIHKEMAGVYTYLPLGLRVLKRIENIIREEMNALGGQELLMTSLQDPEPWQASGRWDDKVVDIWFKTKLSNQSELGLANTHEEPLARLLKQHVSSYKDLPFSAYQFQNKFRNELRAKSGILRGREFIMKDLYSFCRTQEEHDDFYEKAKQAYVRIFERLGIGHQTYLTFASGGSFSRFSHEFQTLTESGEDIIYVDEAKKIAVNKEVYTDDVLESLGLDKNNLVERKAIEVGNTFSLGTRFSDALGLNFTDSEGKSKPVIMGSYGIGLGRAMGTIVEVLSDDKGTVWPKEVTPFDVHVVELGGKKPEVKQFAGRLLDVLDIANLEVLYDDRDASAGEKFNDRDLIGLPLSIVVSEKGIADGTVEVTVRATGNSERVPISTLKEHIF